MNNYLYPLSSASGYAWVDPNGNAAPDTGYGYFVASISNRNADTEMFLRTSFRKVAVGDRLWLYYGKADLDVGIVGVAMVTRLTDAATSTYPDCSADYHGVTIDVDYEATINLIRHPIRAEYLRTFWSRPRSICPMDAYPPLVRACEKRAGLSRSHLKAAS
jgi:hypothetical protein